MTRPFCECVLLDRSCLATVEDVPVGSGEVPLMVVGAACVVEFGEEDGVARSVDSDEVSVVASVVEANETEVVMGLVDTNEVSVVACVVDANETEEVVGLVDTNGVSVVDSNEAEGVVGLVEYAVVAFTVVSRRVPFEAVVVSSLALHSMPCRRVPKMNKQNRQLRN